MAGGRISVPVLDRWSTHIKRLAELAAESFDLRVRVQRVIDAEGGLVDVITSAQGLVVTPSRSVQTLLAQFDPETTRELGPN